MKKRHKNPRPPREPPKEVSMGQRKEVLGLFRECFLALHPKEGWPEWLDTCADAHCHVAEAGQSTFSLIAYPDPAAHDPDYFWQEWNGHRQLFWIDKKTGEKRVVLNWSCKPSEIVTLFHAVLEMKTAVVTVLVDSDFSKMDGGKLLRGASGPLSSHLWWYELR
jgi:hypothetical protein